MALGGGTGLSVEEAVSMLTDVDVKMGFTNQERQSAALFLAPEIHSKVILYMASSLCILWKPPFGRKCNLLIPCLVFPQFICHTFMSLSQEKYLYSPDGTARMPQAYQIDVAAQAYTTLVQNFFTLTALPPLKGEHEDVVQSVAAVTITAIVMITTISILICI